MSDDELNEVFVSAAKMPGVAPNAVPVDPLKLPENDFQAVRINLIGLGGIGSKLADELARYMTHTERAPKELILVDGDVYSQGNLERQSVLESDVGLPKAKVWADGLAQEFRMLTVRAICGYVGKRKAEGTADRPTTVPIDQIAMESSITVVGVDNHATRKLFSDYFQEIVQNGVLISGGNNMTDGSIITAIRMNGKNLTPAIDTFHPEIRNPKDKNPAELSCAELAKVDGGTQVIWANLEAASKLGNEIHCVVTGEWERLKKRGEVYFDILENAAMPRLRMVEGKEVKEEGPIVIAPHGSPLRPSRTRAKPRAQKAKKEPSRKKSPVKTKAGRTSTAHVSQDFL